jgi:hypothetical protein
VSCSREDALACKTADPHSLTCICGLEHRTLMTEQPSVEELSWPAGTSHGFGGTSPEPERGWLPPRAPDPSGLKEGDKIPEGANVGGSPTVWRSCWYCGSMHPEDLHRFLVDGTATMHGCDWKYGWPHKFYVDVVNPDPDRLWLVSTRSGGPCRECRAAIWACRPYTTGGPELPPLPEWPPAKPDCDWCDGSGFNPHHVSENAFGTYPRLHGKFYNVHLLELEQAALDALTPLVLAQTGIRFSLDANGRLFYSAPRRGYQR